MTDDEKVPLPPMPPMTKHEWVRGITIAGYTETQMRDYARAYAAAVERAARAAAQGEIDALRRAAGEWERATKDQNRMAVRYCRERDEAAKALRLIGGAVDAWYGGQRSSADTMAFISQRMDDCRALLGDGGEAK